MKNRLMCQKCKLRPARINGLCKECSHDKDMVYKGRANDIPLQSN